MNNNVQTDENPPDSEVQPSYSPHESPFSNIRLCVIGDMLKDIYIPVRPKSSGAHEPLSETDHIWWMDETNRLVFPGGAANVLQNFIGLGATNGLAFVQRRGSEHKIRLMSDAYKLPLFRFDTREDNWLSVDQGILAKFLLERPPDALVISDYRKGAITPEVARCVVELIRPETQLYVHTKGSPTAYAEVNDAIFVCNRSEYSVRPAEYSKLSTVIVTEGDRGACIIKYGSLESEWPALPTTPISVVGAGDSFYAGFVAWHQHTGGLGSAVEFGNVCGACAVAEPYTTAVTWRQTYEMLKNSSETLGIGRMVSQRTGVLHEVSLD